MIFDVLSLWLVFLTNAKLTTDDFSVINSIFLFQERYKEVKARNGQLLKMLQQGESKCRTANTADRLKSCIYSGYL